MKERERERESQQNDGYNQKSSKESESGTQLAQ